MGEIGVIEKPFLTYQEQIAKLRDEKKLQIVDEEQAIALLKNIVILRSFQDISVLLKGKTEHINFCEEYGSLQPAYLDATKYNYVPANILM